MLPDIHTSPSPSQMIEDLINFNGNFLITLLFSDNILERK